MAGRRDRDPDLLSFLADGPSRQAEAEDQGHQTQQRGRDCDRKDQANLARSKSWLRHHGASAIHQQAVSLA